MARYKAQQDDMDEMIDTEATTNTPAEPIIDEAQVEISRLTEALQRERADAMNLRRRHDEQLTGVRSSVKASVITDLLPVIDNLDRALKHIPTELADNDYVKGVSGIVKQFEKTLEGMGVEVIGEAGELFDPRRHEAVSMDEGDDTGEETTEVVKEVLQKGYRLDNDVIRPAMVRVTLQ